MIGAAAARRPAPVSGSPVFHKQMAHKCVLCRIRIFTPGGSPTNRLRLLSRFLSRQRARPLPAPGRALFLWAACGPGDSAAVFVAAVYGEAVCNCRMAHTHAHGVSPDADA